MLLYNHFPATDNLKTIYHEGQYEIGTCLNP